MDIGVISINLPVLRSPCESGKSLRVHVEGKRERRGRRGEREREREREGNEIVSSHCSIQANQ